MNMRRVVLDKSFLESFRADDLGQIARGGYRFVVTMEHYVEVEIRDTVLNSGSKYSVPGISQRLFLGLEAYLPYCVWYLCGSQGRLRDLTVKRAIENVFSLGRKLPDNLYNKLPALVDPTCALKSSDPELYSKTEGIYKDIRNPIFHGKQLVQVVPDKDYLSLLDYFDSLYKSIDSWGPNPYEGWTRPE